MNLEVDLNDVITETRSLLVIAQNNFAERGAIISALQRVVAMKDAEIASLKAASTAQSQDPKQ